jgi:hypothetical protein
MSSNDVATNQNQGSDQKSDANKQQDQAGSGTDDPKQINGKSVVGKKQVVFLFLFFFFILLRAFVNEIQHVTACKIRIIISFFSNQSDWYSQMVQC